MNSVKVFGVAAASLLFAIAGSAQAKDWKTVVIGMEGAYEPYNLTDPSGKIVGFEPDLAMDLCARMKVECKIIAQDWDGMIPGLQGRQVRRDHGRHVDHRRAQEADRLLDPLCATSRRPSPPPSRARSPSSPDPGKVINFDKDKAGGDAALKALRDALKGKTIGVQVSTTHATFAGNHLKDVATIKEYKTTDERDLDLKSGRIDAVLDDQTAIASMLAKDDAKDFTEFGPQLTGGDFGVGVGMGIRKSRRGSHRQVRHGAQGRVRRRIDQEILPEVVQDRHHALIERKRDRELDRQRSASANAAGARRCSRAP